MQRKCRLSLHHAAVAVFGSLLLVALTCVLVLLVLQQTKEDFEMSPTTISTTYLPTTTEDPMCSGWVCDTHDSSVVLATPPATTYLECLAACTELPVCLYVTFTRWRGEPLCSLLLSCHLTPPCEGGLQFCESGPKNCS